MASTSDPYIDYEPGALVQRFSWEIEERNQRDTDTREYSRLGLDLIAERPRRIKQRVEAISSINAHFTAPQTDDEIVLGEAKLKLFQVMQRFQDLVPGQSGTGAVPMSWDKVRTTVLEVQAEWDSHQKDSKSGQVRSWVRRMCTGMNNHATALKMLPGETEFVSLIAGSVSMIIKASANHTNISEAFAKGVVVINDAVKMESLSHVYHTTQLEQLTMRLYTNIFSYLIKFMTWFTGGKRSRFLNSFNENLLDLFKEDLAQVKSASELLSRSIQLHMSADVRIVKIHSEALSEDMSQLLRFAELGERRNRVRDAANAELIEGALHRYFQMTTEKLSDCVDNLMQGYQEMIRSGISGSGITNLLQQQAVRPMQLDRPLSRGSQDEANSSSIPSSTSGVDTLETAPEQQREGVDIRVESSRLEDFFSWDHVHPVLRFQTPLQTEANFAARLNTFTRTLEPQILYAHSRRCIDGVDLLRLSACAYASLARDAKVPVISYFCQLSHDEPPPQRTRESIESSALMCAVIRQLVRLLPVESNTSSALLQQSGLLAMDGTLRTWDEALSALEQLLIAVRLPLLLFVIDGINVLEDEFESSTKRQLRSFVSCLQRLTSATIAADGNAIVKVLLTTSGLSATLLESLDDSAILHCDASPSVVPSMRQHQSRQVLFYDEGGD